MRRNEEAKENNFMWAWKDHCHCIWWPQQFSGDVITHLEPDILECKVKKALGSITMIKAGGGYGISAELFKILKDNAVKVLHSIYQQIWKTQQWPQDWKRSAFIPNPKKGNAKECSYYFTIALISQISKVMLKILQARLQQCVNKELPNVQAGFRKDRGMRYQIANICWIIENQWNSRKISTSASLMILKPLTMWITRNCGKFLWEYLPTLPSSWETSTQVKKQHLELVMEQQTGSKLGKEYVKAGYCHPVYLTYRWSASCELPGWMKFKLESSLLGEQSIITNKQMTPSFFSIYFY